MRFITPFSERISITVCPRGTFGRGANRRAEKRGRGAAVVEEEEEEEEEDAEEEDPDDDDALRLCGEVGCGAGRREAVAVAVALVGEGERRCILLCAVLWTTIL